MLKKTTTDLTAEIDRLKKELSETQSKARKDHAELTKENA